MHSSAILQRFQAAASRYPDRPAIIGTDYSISYAELERRAASVARRIADRASGPTVALLYSNTPEFAPLFLGAVWAGKTVAVLPTLAPPPLLKLMCMETGVDLVITSEAFLPHMLALGMHCWIGDASAEFEPSQVPQRPNPSEAAVLLYTSGTTGRPKAVALSEENILANIDGCKNATGFDDSHVMLAVLPLFHAYGLTVSTLLPLTTGACVVVPEKFIPRQILQLIEKHRVSCLIAVPGQYRVLIKEPTVIDARTQRLLADTLTLANQLGATVFTFKGQDVADTILRFANEYRCGQVVIGRPRPIPWWKRLSGHVSVAEQLIHRSHGVTVVVVDAESDERTASNTPAPALSTADLAGRPGRAHRDLRAIRV